MNRVLTYRLLPLFVVFAFTLLAGLRGNLQTWPGCLPPILAGGVVWMFARLLQLLSPGTLVLSRLLYSVLALSMAPVFVAGGTGDHFAMAAILLLLLLVYSLVLAVEAGSRRQLVHAIVLPILGVCLLFWLKNDLNWSKWSFFNLFRRHFPDGQYTLPNLLHVLTPLCHIGFFLFLPVLFAVVRKTDFYLATKQILATGLIGYVVLIGGLPAQNQVWLLPAYVLVLCLLFPAWDRFIAYGFYFLKKHWMYLALGISATVQIVATTLVLFGII